MKLLGSLAKEIIKYSTKRVGERLERNHKILKILKGTPFFQLKEDFDSIYAHTLVEYGIEKTPSELVVLFALEEVKQALYDELCNNK